MTNDRAAQTAKRSAAQIRAAEAREALVPLLKQLDSAVYHYPAELRSAGDLRHWIDMTLRELQGHGSREARP